MMKKYIDNSGTFPEILYWNGVGNYASKMEGSHKEQRVITVHCGDDNPYKNGYGTPFFLSKPYGKKDGE